MFDTIVVGTDGSFPARRALATAAELAERFEPSRIHVVSGYRPVGEGELRRLAQEVPAEFRDLLTGDGPGVQIVDEAVATLRTHDLDVVGHPLPESGAEAILDVAEHVGADLIVVGSRGEGAGRRLLHGSVSTKVAHHAECDVLIVHEPPE